MKKEFAEVMLETIETMVRDAYLRGTHWRDENPDGEFRIKAACDYADKVTSAGRQYWEELNK